MNLRRINAALGLMTGLWVVEHLLYMGYHMCTKPRVVLRIPKALFPILVTLIGVHALIGIIIALRRHNYRKEVSAWKKRLAEKGAKIASEEKHPTPKRHHTPLLRWSGFILLPAAFLHFYSKRISFLIGLPARFYGVVNLLFYTLAALHIAVSIPCSLHTLGLIEHRKEYRRISIVCAVVCLAIAVFDILGCLKYYFKLPLFF